MISTVGVGSTVLQTCVNQTAKNGGKKGASNKTLPIDTTALRLCPIGPLDSLTASLHFKFPTQCPHFPPPPPHPCHKQMALQTPGNLGVAAPARRILSGNIAPISEPCWASSRVHRGHRWGNCRRAGDRSLSKNRATRASLLQGRYALKPRACPVDLSGRQRDRAIRRRTDLQRTRRYKSLAAVRSAGLHAVDPPAVQHAIKASDVQGRLQDALVPWCCRASEYELSQGPRDPETLQNQWF